MVVGDRDAHSEGVDTTQAAASRSGTVVFVAENDKAMFPLPRYCQSSTVSSAHIRDFCLGFDTPWSSKQVSCSLTARSIHRRSSLWTTAASYRCMLYHLKVPLR